MSVNEFLERTATADREALRRALAAGLAAECPRTATGYQRLYRRVLAALDRPAPAARPRRAA